MKKWEDKYEEYKDGGIDNVISKLVENGISTKEEKREYRKLNKIKEKMSQIEHVVEYRDRLKEELNQLKEEIKLRENLSDASKKKIELEEKISKYQERYEEIAKALRNSKLDPDKRAQLEEEKNKINVEMPKAQDEMNNQEKILESGLRKKTESFKLTREDSDKKAFELQNKISKCNLVAKNLLNGVSWEQIDLKLDNWVDRKFTSKDDKLAKDIELAKKTRKEKIENFKIETRDPSEEMVDLMELSEKLSKEDNNLYNKPDLTFEKKHPILGKVSKFFKKLKEKFSKKEVETKEYMEPKKEEKEEKENKNENEEKPFKEYIKEIAEKGIDGLESEEKAKRKKELESKLAKMREENRNKEAIKFGKEYAKKSDYRQNNDYEGR